MPAEAGKRMNPLDIDSLSPKPSCFYIAGPLPCLDRHEIDDLQIMQAGISFFIRTQS
jgi:hypothetical protein